MNYQLLHKYIWLDLVGWWVWNWKLIYLTWALIIFLVAVCRGGQAGVCSLQAPGSIPEHGERHPEEGGGPKRTQPHPDRQLPHPVRLHHQGVQPCVCVRPCDLHPGAPGCKVSPGRPQSQATLQGWTVNNWKGCALIYHISLPLYEKRQQAGGLHRLN